MYIYLIPKDTHINITQLSIFTIKHTYINITYIYTNKIKIHI